jgi:formiminoglutamase
MENFIRFSNIDLAKITNHRFGEVKFGEKIQVTPHGEDVFDYIKKSDAKFVLFGIPEDIGVKANFGKTGAASAWQVAIKSIANIQHNKFCKGSQILLLGALNLKTENALAATLDFNITDERKQLHKLVEKIDKEVSHIVYSIIKSGKIPIIIGGGHNNAYGNIKGAALATGKPLNCINFDAHSDFRVLEGRHSGNGFSYAYDEGFLKKYFIFGLHESYTSKNVLINLKNLEDRVRYNTYDEIAIRKEKSFDQELHQALSFIKNDKFGIEIDLDALPNIASSALTPSGFSIESVRGFIHFMGQNPNATYLHICEGAPDLDEANYQTLVGKLIAYLITDFIKSKSNT